MTYEVKIRNKTVHVSARDLKESKELQKYVEYKKSLGYVIKIEGAEKSIPSYEDPGSDEYDPLRVIKENLRRSV